MIDSFAQPLVKNDENINLLNINYSYFLMLFAQGCASAQVAHEE